MFTILAICLFATNSIITVSAQKKYHNQSEVIDDMLNNMFACVQELDLNPDVCGDMLLKDTDHSAKIYDNCKCFGPCVGKKMGTMNPETGKWNWDRLKELSALMESESLKNESLIMEKACFDDVNTHCEAGFAFMKCAMENSPMTQELAKNYMASKENAKKN